VISSGIARRAGEREERAWRAGEREERLSAVGRRGGSGLLGSVAVRLQDA
jgi:hypothetical protein